MVARTTLPPTTIQRQVVLYIEMLVCCEIDFASLKSFFSGNFEANGVTTSNYVTPVPPLSSNVIITGHNKWGIPSTKITSGGVTVTTSPRVRPHSQGPLMGSTGKLSGNALNQSTGSIGLQQNAISVHHASPASPTFQTNQKSVMTLPINSSLKSGSNVIAEQGFVPFDCFLTILVSFSF